MLKDKKSLFVIPLLLAFTNGSNAQTLFTYGKRAVSKDEFLKAYNKNNTGDGATDKSYSDYLELYSRFKIKVQQALDMKLDTLPQQKAELAGFRSQVVDSYMNDEASTGVLIDEAVERAKKDIHLAHIFVAVSGHATDADAKKAEDKINAAYAELQKGTDFGKVATEFSEDPSVKENKGDLGYITVFVLPYGLENLAYNTQAGKFSAPFRSKAGYHIFKNLGERKAAGRLKVAQILFTFPSEASAEVKQQIKQKADSVYNLLTQGGDFKALALQFSSDNLSYQNGGELIDFGVGRYEPAFETAAFALQKDGDISKPVLTSFGYHIIKHLQAKPINTNVDNRQAQDSIKLLVQQSDRMEVSRKILYKKILQLTGFKKLPVNENHLWVFTDSILKHAAAPKFTDVTSRTPLFSFAKKTVTVKDWQEYLDAIQGLNYVRNGKTKKELFDQFTETSAFDYYRDHLEEYNKDFAWQLNEFKEGNLLFEVMQRKVWSVASADSVGLKKYYQAHKDKYWWEASADAIIVTANSETANTEGVKKFGSNYKDWKQYIENSNGALQGDSGRFELGQIPVVERTNFTPGLITAPVKNTTDNTFTFAYIVQIYRDRAQRSFDDARGFVINDYQNALEEQWIADLKKKYPITVNLTVLKSLEK
ncbi:MAG: peptidylprolyl isomerase [Chitinophagaceae bacterium]